MLVTRSSLIIITLVLNIMLLKVFDFGTILAGLVTFFLVIFGYIIYANIRQGRRYNLLEQDLDPEAFIKATEKQMEITGKNKRACAILNGDLIVGLLSMRRYEEAKDILDKIDIKYLSKFNGSILIYYT